MGEETHHLSWQEACMGTADADAAIKAHTTTVPTNTSIFIIHRGGEWPSYDKGEQYDNYLACRIAKVTR